MENEISIRLKFNTDYGFIAKAMSANLGEVKTEEQAGKILATAFSQLRNAVMQDFKRYKEANEVRYDD